MTKLTASGLCLVIITVFASGCGPAAPPTVPASGVVLLDGKPLEGASINCLSENGAVAIATSDANGKFKLITTIGGDTFEGAVTGAHKVGVSKATNDGETGPKQTYADNREMATKMGGMTSMVKQTYIVAQRFNSPERSGLKIDVPAGGSDALEIKVSGK